MQNSTIKKILGNKINQWLKTLPEDLREQVKPNVIVTGGSIVSLLTGEPVNDYDVYFKNGNIAQAVAEYYIRKFIETSQLKFKYGKDVRIRLYRNQDVVFDSDQNNKNAFHNPSFDLKEDRVYIAIQSAGIAGNTDENYQYFEMIDPNNGEQSQFIDSIVHAVEQSNNKDGKGKYECVFLTGNAITLTDDIQLVIRFFGEPSQIHENYDFVHCTCYYDHGTNELVLPQKALESILDKRLWYTGSKYPICSLIRMRKFIQRGWKISAGQIFKMCFQVSELDLTDYDVLKEQLTGVDYAYFYQLIEALKQKDSQNVDTTYMMELIDKIV